jgi:hypothetical protein
MLEQHGSVHSSGFIYDHPTKLDKLPVGKYDQLVVDRLLYNYQLAKSLYPLCRYIYMIRSPERSLPVIMQHGYTAETAVDYYCFRLRRLCEMKTPQQVVFTYDQLLSGDFNGINQLLNIQLTKYFVPFNEGSFVEGKVIENALEPMIEIPVHLLKRAKQKYNKYSTHLLRK